MPSGKSRCYNDYMRYCSEVRQSVEVQTVLGIVGYNLAHVRVNYDVPGCIWRDALIAGRDPRDLGAVRARHYVGHQPDAEASRYCRANLEIGAQK
jgi:hypothetical protein